MLLELLTKELEALEAVATTKHFTLSAAGSGPLVEDTAPPTPNSPLGPLRKAASRVGTEPENPHASSTTALSNAAIARRHSAASSGSASPKSSRRSLVVPLGEQESVMAAKEARQPEQTPAVAAPTGTGLAMVWRESRDRQFSSVQESEVASTSPQSTYQFLKYGASGASTKNSLQVMGSSAGSAPVGSGSLAGVRLWPLWEAPLPAPSTPQQFFSFNKHVKVKYGDHRREKGYLQRIVIRPSSVFRISWDLMSILCMFYDVMFIPMQVFPMHRTETGRLLDLFTVIFWSLDIPVSFFSGYREGGVLEMRPRMIATHYLRTLFPIDIVIVFVDWLVFINTADEERGAAGVVDFGRLMKWTRIFRLLSLLRALRLIKVISIVLRVADNISVYFSEGVVIMVHILNALLVILLVCHFFACGWYFIGTSSQSAAADNRGSWVAYLESQQGSDLSLTYRYATSLHWALTQFTPSSMEVVPRNTGERIYAIATMLVALVTFSVFISGVTGTMARMRITSLDSHRLLHSIRRFILEHRLSLDVGMKIQEFVRRNHDQLRRRQVSDFSILQRLPKRLRQDLQKEIFLPMLVRHPLFWHHCEFFQDESLLNICDAVMNERFVLECEQLTICSQEATHAYFFNTGDCTYVRGHTAAPGLEETPIAKGSMIAEAALWIPWYYQGIVNPQGPYWVMAMNVDEYHKIVKRAPVFRCVVLYARQYLDWIVTIPEKELSDLSTDMNKSHALEWAQVAFDGCNHVKFHNGRADFRRSKKLLKFMTGTTMFARSSNTVMSKTCTLG